MKVNLPKTKFFCDLYWQRQRQNLIQSGVMNHRTHVRYHCDLNNVNSFLLGLNHVEFDMPKMIRETDIDFCCLKPTEQQMVLWRGVGCPKENLPTYYYFKESLNLKKGDIIRLPGYIFADSKEDTAKIFAFSKLKKGIIYKINVPQGSHISYDNHYVFPRNSKFICTDSHAVNDKTQSYQLISLDYIKPNKYDNSLYL